MAKKRKVKRKFELEKETEAAIKKVKKRKVKPVKPLSLTERDPSEEAFTEKAETTLAPIKRKVKKKKKKK